MRPAFSNALYYPSIDIRNTDWLKTAALFWDTIYTIVPKSVEVPYTEYETQYLADIGFIRPLVVNSSNKSVVAIEEDVISMLSSSEVQSKVFSPEPSHISYIPGDNMSSRVKEAISEILQGGAIYPPTKKMRRKLQNKERDFFQQRRSITKRDLDLGYLKFGDEAFFLDSDIVARYMAALADRLCEDHSLGMVTDDASISSVGEAARLGKSTSVIPEDPFLDQRPREQHFAQGMLLDCIISGLSISPGVELPDVISFRESHMDELGKFRTRLSRLTQGFSADKSREILRQEIEDLYTNEFLPAFNDLKAALKGANIQWLADNFLKVSMVSAGATAVPMALLGLPVEHAIFAGAGVSVLSSAITYRVDKGKALRENPYSYLLSIEREWPGML